MQPKQIKSMELNFRTEKEYKEFIDYINHPPPASEFVKNLIKDYKEKNEKE